MSRERYECTRDGHRKFWEVFSVDEWSGDWVVRVRFGRIGTNGQERSKLFTYRSAADRYRSEKISEKLGKGYVIKYATPLTPDGRYGAHPINQRAKIAVVPPCGHASLSRKGSKYECTACKAVVEFDRPQVDTPEVQTKVRRFFDMRPRENA